MKRLLTLLLVLLCPAAFAQTPVPVAPISGQAVNQYGQPIPYALIRVCEVTSTGIPCTPTAQLYQDYYLTVPISNPISADQYGNYLAYVGTASPVNLYTVQVSATQGLTWSYVENGPATGGGGGGGTVTSVACGNLYPIFTCSVANPNSTAAINFALSTAPTHSFLGNFTSGTAAPSYWTLAAGTGITLTPSGNTLTIAAQPPQQFTVFQHNGTNLPDQVLVNFNDATPAPPSGYTNVIFQDDSLGDLSAYVPTGGGSGCGPLSGDATSTDCGNGNLFGTGTNSEIYGFTNGLSGNAENGVILNGTGNDTPMGVSFTEGAGPIVANGINNFTLGTATLDLGDVYAIGNSNFNGGEASPSGSFEANTVIALGLENICGAQFGTSSIDDVYVLGETNLCYSGTGTMSINNAEIIGDTNVNLDYGTGTDNYEDIVAIGDTAMQLGLTNANDTSHDLIGFGHNTIVGDNIHDVEAGGDFAVAFLEGSNDVVAHGDELIDDLMTSHDLDLGGHDILYPVTLGDSLNQSDFSYIVAHGYNILAGENDTGLSGIVAIGSNLLNTNNLSGLTNINCIGQSTPCTQSNQTAIGNSSITSLLLWGCPSGQTVYDDGSGTCYTPGSGSGGFPIVLGSTSIAASSTTTSVAGLSVNGVTLTTGDASTTFLNGAGAYTTPAGSGSGTVANCSTQYSFFYAATTGTTATCDTNLTDNGSQFTFLLPVATASTSQPTQWSFTYDAGHAPTGLASSAVIAPDSAGNFDLNPGNTAFTPLVPLASGFTSGDCGTPTLSGGIWTMVDAGAACNTGGFANPMTTEGDLIYGGASGAATRLPAGTSGYYLQTLGTGFAPQWAAVSGSGGVQYNPTTTSNVFIGDSRLIRATVVSVTPSAGTCNGTTCTIPATNTYAIGTDYVQFDASAGAWSPSCINWMIAPVITGTTGSQIVVPENTGQGIPTSQGCTGSQTVTPGSGVLTLADYFTPALVNQLPFFNGHGTVYNYGIAGGTVATMISNYSAGWYTPMSPSVTGAPGFAFFTSNGNDLAGGATVATIKSHWCTLWGDMHSIGYKNIQMTVPLATDDNSIFDTHTTDNLQILNLWFNSQTQGNSAGTCSNTSTQYIDGLIDVASAINQNDPNMYGDLPHFNNSGSQVSANIVNMQMSTQASLAPVNPSTFQGGIQVVGDQGYWLWDPTNLSGLYFELYVSGANTYPYEAFGDTYYQTAFDSFHTITGGVARVMVPTGGYGWNAGGVGSAPITGSPDTLLTRDSTLGSGWVDVGDGTLYDVSGGLQLTNLVLAGLSGTSPVCPNGTHNALTTVGCSSSGATLQTNSSNNSSQSLLNMETSTTNAVGLTVTPSNPSGGIEKFEITGASYTGNAATATDLASYPTPCSGGQFSQGISSGSNNCGTPSGSGVSLTTFGSSGAATLISNVLNIPVYSSSSAPVVLNWTINSGIVATDAAPRFLAAETATISDCYVLTTASDGSTGLAFNVFDNGSQIISGSPTVAAGTAAGTLTTFSSLSVTSITSNDKISMTITGGTSNWVFTVQCK